MSDGVPYADIIILALIAGFILLRLRSTLGQSDGKPSFFKPEATIEGTKDGIIQLADKSAKLKPIEESDPYLEAVTDTTMAKTLADIKTCDPSFNATAFLQGAKGAYEMVFDAFAKGDVATLKMLMSAALFKHFKEEIDARAKTQEHPEVTLVSIVAKSIAKADLTGTTAHLSVHFSSEQVSVMRNQQGIIVGGNASDIHHVEDEWLFERDLTSKNPNWKIIET